MLKLGEAGHAVGQAGVERIKTWLESTTRFRLPYDAYQINPQTGVPFEHVEVDLLDGTRERFDLTGEMLDGFGQAGHQIFVECKTYETIGGQGSQYSEYLAVSYSAFKRARDLRGGMPPDIEFMWATTHPFSVTNYWRLNEPDVIGEACERHIQRLGRQAFDSTTAQELAGRLWLCIVNRRVEEMQMSNALLGVVRAHVTATQ